MYNSLYFAIVILNVVLSNGTPHYGYKAEHMYIYKYEGQALGGAKGPNDAKNEMDLKFNADVKIRAVTENDFLLMMDHFRLIETLRTGEGNSSKLSENSDKMDSALSKYPLRFSFYNGKIDRLHPADEEEIWSLNMKRGILSLIQNTMIDLDGNGRIFENDISGNCETNYETELQTDTYHVKKIKKISSCTGRTNVLSIVNSTPHDKTHSKNILPFLENKYDCLQKFDIKQDQSLLLKFAECREKNNAVLGFAKIHSSTLHSLQFVNEVVEEIEITGSFTNFTKGINYEKTFQQSDSDQDYNAVLQLMKDFRIKTENGVQSETSDVFSKLLDILRRLKKEKLVRLFDDVLKKAERKLFINAFSLVLTTDSIQAMKQVYENQQISQEEVDLCITSLALTKDPSLEMIEVINHLSEYPMRLIRHKPLLTLSSLVYNYCKSNQFCTRKKTIRESISTIEYWIKDTCVPKSSEEYHDILLSLKAIGNAGVTTNPKYLQNCIKNDNAAMELRVASISAHRRIPCSQDLNLGFLLNIFSNQSMNVELRIASYLRIMDCASVDTIQNVKRILREEKSNQVGSFVWSHLLNLQRTETGWKRALKEFVQSDYLRYNFDLNHLKYSRNYEISSFLNSISAGGSVETNVVFTPDSYLPKSATINMTLDVFGTEINLLEIGARVEGFEEILWDKMKEPNYPLDEYDEMEKNHTMKINKEILNIKDQVYRLGRQIRKNYYNLRKEPKGQMYIRIFGHEIAFQDFNRLDDLLKNKAVAQFFETTASKEIDYLNSFEFLRTTYSIPTVLGIPLELSLRGVGTLGLKMNNGLLNDEDFQQWRIRKLNVHPSISAKVVAELCLDFPTNRIGISVTSDVHSNTILDGYSEDNYNSRKVLFLDLKLNVPLQKYDIFSTETKMYLIANGKELEVKENNPHNLIQKKLCTSKVVSTISGMQLCSYLEYNKDQTKQEEMHFPSVPFKYSLELLKTDDFNSYEFHLKLFDVFAWTGFDISFDTPGSRINRLINAQLKSTQEYNVEVIPIILKLQTPKFEFITNANISNYKNSSDIFANFLIEYNKNEVVVEAGIVIEKGENMVIKPRFKLQHLQLLLANVVGSIYFKDPTNMNVSLEFNSDSAEAMNIEGEMKLDPIQQKIFGELKSKLLEAYVEGVFRVFDRKQKHLIPEVGFTVSYIYNNQPKQETSTKLRISENSHLQLYNLFFASTHVPQYNTEILWEKKVNRDQSEFTAMLNYNQVNWKANFAQRNTTTKYLIARSMSSSLISSIKNIDYKADYKHIWSKSKFYLHGLLQMNKKKRIEANFDCNVVVNDGNETVRSMDTSIYYPVNEIQIISVIKQDKAGVYPVTLTGYQRNQNNKKKFIQLNGTLSDLQDDTFNFKNYMHTFVATLDFPESETLQGPWNIESRCMHNFDNQSVTYKGIVITKNKTTHELTFSYDFVFPMYSIKSAHISMDGKEWATFEYYFLPDRNISFTVGLNLYQHYEFFVYERFYADYGLGIYWDKINNKKIAGYVSRISYPSFKLELPDTSIIANLDIKSQFVSGEIAWELDNPKKINFNFQVNKLNVTNIGPNTPWAYDGNLTTPFEYFKVVHWNLMWQDYTINAERNANIEVKVRWDDVNSFKMAVTKHVLEKIDLDDTRISMEIESKYSDENHTNVELLYLKTKNLITLFVNSTTNEHNVKINAKNYKDDVSNIVDFSLETVTNSVTPIKVLLESMKHPTFNTWDAYIRCGEKIIDVKSKLKDDHSYIIINTPFKYLHNTHFEYNIVAGPEQSEMLLQIDLLDDTYKITSSIKTEDRVRRIAHAIINSNHGGPYELTLTTSTLKNELEEKIEIKRDGKALFLWKINGFVKDISNFRVKVESNVTDENCLFHVTFDTVDQLYNIGLESSKFENRLLIEYEGSPKESEAILDLEFPNGYNLQNTYNRKLHKNILIINTPNGTVNVGFAYNLEGSRIDLINRLDTGSGKKYENTFFCEWNNGADILDRFHVSTKLDEAFSSIFQFKELDLLLEAPRISDHVWQPKLIVQRNTENILYLGSNVTIKEHKREITLFATSPYFEKFNGLAKYEKGDKTMYVNNLLITVERGGKKHEIQGKINVEQSQGTVAIIYEKIYPNFLFKYDCTKPLKALQVMYTYGENKIYLEAEGHKNNGTLETKVNLRTSNKNWEKNFATVKMDTIHKNFLHVVFERNDRKLNLDFITNSQRCDEKYTTFDLTSDLKIAPKFSISVRNETIENSKQLSIKALCGNFAANMVNKQHSERNREINLDLSIGEGKNVSVKGVKKMDKFSVDVHGMYLNHTIFMGSAKEKLFYMQLNHDNSNIFLYDITVKSDYHWRNNTNVVNAMIRLKHPYSKIDRTVEITQSKCHKFVNTRMIILNPNPDKNILESVNAHLVYPLDSNELLVSLQTTTNKIKLQTFDINENDLKKSIIHVQVNENEPALFTISKNPSELSVKYSKGREYFELYFAGPTATKFGYVLRTDEVTYNGTVNDLGIHIELKNPRLLLAMLSWDPKILLRLENVLGAELEEIQRAANSMTGEITEIINSQSNKKLIDNIVAALEEIQTARRAEYETVKGLVQKFLKDFIKEFKANVSYLAEVIHDISNVDVNKIIDQLLDSIVFEIMYDFALRFDEIFEYTGVFIKHVISYYKNIENLKDNMKTVFQQFHSKCSSTYKKLPLAVSNLQKTLEHAYKMARDEWQKIHENPEKALESILRKMSGCLKFVLRLYEDIPEKIREILVGFREVEEMATLLDDARGIAANGCEKLKKSIICIMENMQDDLKCILEYYEPFINKLFEGESTVTDKLSPIKDSYKTIQETWKGYFNFVWKRINFSKIVEDLRQNLFSYWVDTLPLKYVDKFIIVETNRICPILFFSCRYERIHQDGFKIYQYLPFEWLGFDMEPHFSSNPIYLLYDVIDIINPTYDYPYRPSTELKTLYNYYAKILIPEPAANNVAMLIGSSKFLTFNQMYFKFKGKCSYLLMSQFVNDKFIIILNFEEVNRQRRKKSLSVIVKNDHFEVHMNGTLLRNGKLVEYPIIDDELFILKEPRGFTIKLIYNEFLWYGQGVTMLLITCTEHYDICTFKTNGWNFGQVAGLLGTLHNEKMSKNVYTSYGYNVDDNNLKKYMESWKIDMNERCIEQAVINEEDDDEYDPEYGKCDKLFSLKFTTNDCFNQVQPDRFYNMCYRKNTNLKHTCQIEFAYKTICKSFNVNTNSMTNECAICEDQNKDDQDKGENNSTDIILLLKEYCVFDGKDLAIKLDKALNSHGITNNKYALIQYYNAVHSSAILTSNQKIWNDATEILNSYERQQFHPRKPWHNNIFQNLVALKNRPKNSRIIIFTSCLSRSFDLQKDYVMIDEFLKEGVKFHNIISRKSDLEDNDVPHFLSKVTNGSYIEFDINEVWADSIATSIEPKIASDCKCSMYQDIPSLKCVNPSAPDFGDLAEDMLPNDN